jgi:hypothetical protein
MNEATERAAQELERRFRKGETLKTYKGKLRAILYSAYGDDITNQTNAATVAYCLAIGEFFFDVLPEVSREILTVMLEHQDELLDRPKLILRDFSYALDELTNSIEAEKEAERRHQQRLRDMNDRPTGRNSQVGRR